MAELDLSSISALPASLSVITLAILILLILLCVCHGHKEKSPDFGIPGRLSSITTEIPAIRMEPIENGDTLQLKLDDHQDSKYKTVVERALPDIPKSFPASIDTDTDQTPDSGSECYATVNKISAAERNNAYKHQSATAETQEAFLASTSGVSLPVTGSELVSSPEQTALRTKEVSIPGSSSQKPHEYDHVHKPHHPYARLSNQLESDPGTDDYDESQSSGRDRQKRTKSTSDVNGLTQSDQSKTDKDLSSPSSSSTGPSVEEPRPCSTLAGQAVAGNVPSAEIPYMTPPLALPAATNNTQFPTTSNSQEAPYTVISVREPLDRVRMQIQKLRRKQNSNQGSSLDEPEGYYMEVPDDDQTYAEIESGQNSGESSTMYDHIDPRNALLPPDPPTVESLKSVAQAHSRQASIASMSSFGSNGDGQSSAKDFSALYSVVDKSNKKQQSAQGGSESPDSSKQGDKSEHSVDDLYAKVQKKKNSGATMSVSGIEDVLRNEAIGNDEVFNVRGSWSPAKSYSESPPVLPPTGNRQYHLELSRRHSAEPELLNRELSDEAEPGYATVTNSDKEQKNKIVISKPIEDPGYERIQNNKDVDSDIDPGYELIRKRSVRSAKEGSDPGYESVRNMHRLEEPGYERVKHLGRTDSDCVDPGYERVRRTGQRRDTDRTDPDYECIKYLHRNDSDAVDPGYESVKRVGRSNSDIVDPGYEPIKRSPEEDNSSVIERHKFAEAASQLRDSATSSFYNQSGGGGAVEPLNGDLAVNENQPFIVTGERISIRINCQNANTVPIVAQMEGTESSSEMGHATNLILVGEPNLNSNQRKLSENGLDILLETQSNLDYETASSGCSTLSSRNGKCTAQSSENVKLLISTTDSASEQVDLVMLPAVNNGKDPVIETSEN